jgi:Tfp pilus assembly protein PilF
LAHAKLALLLAETGRTSAAVAHAEEALGAGLASVRLYALLGLLYFKEGKPEKAEAEYEKALALGPKTTTLLNALGLARMRAGEEDAAGPGRRFSKPCVRTPEACPSFTTWPA